MNRDAGYPPHFQILIDLAVSEGQKSPCQKSQRGAVIFEATTGLLMVAGHNRLPMGVCTGSDACRATCGKRCVHAEQEVLLQLYGRRYRSPALLHIKVVEGVGVPGGPPSCLECSKLILASAVVEVWLWEERPAPMPPEWIRYTPEEFHRVTLRNLGMMETL